MPSQTSKGRPKLASRASTTSLNGCPSTLSPSTSKLETCRAISRRPPSKSTTIGTRGEVNRKSTQIFICSSLSITLEQPKIISLSHRGVLRSVKFVKINGWHIRIARCCLITRGRRRTLWRCSRIYHSQTTKSKFSLSKSLFSSKLP
jgi:hypothetical protein